MYGTRLPGEHESGSIPDITAPGSGGDLALVRTAVGGHAVLNVWHVFAHALALLPSLRPRHLHNRFRPCPDKPLGEAGCVRLSPHFAATLAAVGPRLSAAPACCALHAAGATAVPRQHRLRAPRHTLQL